MIILKNKKATFNYEVLDKFEAGVVLHGFEVKSLKNKRGSFEGSFVTLRKTDNKGKLLNKKGSTEVFLKNFFIPPYQEKNTPDWYDEYRERKLLLNKNEIEKLEKKVNQERLTLIPLNFFVLNHNIKLSFALAKGKKKHDKRESLKKRDDLRNAQREIKNNRF